MAAANKSSIYGDYGGVSNQNHYVPPGNTNFTPKPPQMVFSEADRLLVQQLIDQTSFYSNNAQNILIRTLSSSQPGNIDSFVLATSAKPEDVIIYTSNTDKVDLNRLDGGFF